MRNTQAARGLDELSSAGNRAAVFPAADVPYEGPSEDLIPERFRASRPVDLPELTEPDVVRHFVNLSRENMSVDSHFYPLGSCTMKYNPKRHERWAGLAGLGDVHPYQDVDDIQGLLGILYEMQQMLGEIAGLPGVSLQPAAGAQGEFTALMTAAAYFEHLGQKRTKVLFPSSAHGTNPASAALAGFDTVQLNKPADGYVDLAELESHLDDSTAVFMVTNPNTLGLFEKEIAQVSARLHDVGGLVYIDGANMNAILGVTRPGDFGGDMMHYNVHKTFTGPHGAGGPGSGPIAVRDFLAEFLPGPVVTKHETADGPRFELSTPARSIGRVRSFFGNVGILLRGYFYLRTLGPDGLRAASERAVLNANYLRKRVSESLPVPLADGPCMHEFVASASDLQRETGVTAMDVAKRLVDHGFHPPTVYFPLDVPEALMMEPTETESKATLDAFADAIAEICREDVETVRTAPHSTPVCRPDEVAASRKPVLSWQQAARV
ncbi:MAG: aminomethyl-transferring glycine dehydrogenase subunit GcvPB [Planctomycetota bacterium]